MEQDKLPEEPPVGPKQTRCARVVTEGSDHYNRCCMSDDDSHPPVTKAVEAKAGSAGWRSVRRWLVRGFGGLTAFLLIGYATLPWWLPTTWLARRFEAQLSMDLGRDVRIGVIRVGWRQGVSIGNITVAERGGGPDRFLARIGRIDCGFTPLTTLWTGRVDRLEIVEPEIWLTFDDQGRLVGLDDLGHRKSGKGGFPAWDYRIRNASCHLRMPELAQVFRIDDLTCRIDKPAGVLHVSGRTVIPRNDPDLAPGETQTASLLVEGKVITPKLRQDAMLHGQAHIEWDGLAVTDLPLLIAMRFPIEQLDGSTNGQLVFSVQPDLRIDYDLRIAFRSVRILRRGTTQPAQVPDASFECKGLWDPATDVLALRDFSYETRAVRLRGTGSEQNPSLLLDPAGDTSIAVHAAGEVKDWAALGREFPDVDQWMRSAAVRMEGGAEGSLDFTRRHDEDHLEVLIEGRQLGCRIGPPSSEVLVIEPDLTSRLRVDVSHHGATSLVHLREASLSIGGLSLCGRGQLSLPPPEVSDEWEWLTAAFPSFQYELIARVVDVSELARFLPATQERPPIIQGRGPVELTCSVSPRQQRLRLDVSLVAAAETRLDVGSGLFIKPAGDAIDLAASASVPSELVGRIEEPVFDVRHGRGRVLLVSDEAHAELLAAFEPVRENVSGAGSPAETPFLQATWDLPLKVQGIERLLGLFPGVLAAINDGRGHVDGEADFAVRGRLVGSVDNWLIRNEIGVSADHLSVQWPDVVYKPSGEPLAVTVAHQCEFVAGRCEQSLYADLLQRAGEMKALLVFSEGRADDNRDDVEATAVKVDVKDIDRFLMLVPWLHDAAACVHPVGEARLEFRSLLSDGRFSVVMSADATEAGLTSAESSEPLKTPGTPAQLRLEWETGQLGNGTDDRRWNIVGGSAQFGGIIANRINGLIVVQPAEPPFRVREWARQAVRQRRLPSRIKSAILDAEGMVDLDDSLWRQQPQLKALRETYHLTGNVRWGLECGADNEVLSLKGELDAGGVGLAFDPGWSILSPIAKPPGIPATARFDVAAAALQESGKAQIEAREVEFDLNGNKLNLSGLVSMQADDKGAWAPLDFVADTHTWLSNPAAIREILPACPFEWLDGMLFARVSASGTPQQIDIVTAELGFDQMLVAAGREPVTLDGWLRLDENRLRIDQVQFAWGQSRGTVAGVVREQGADRPHRARLGMFIQQFNQPELLSLVEQLPLSRPQDSRPEGSSTQARQAIVNTLRNLDLDLDLRVDEAIATLPMEVQVEADAAVNRVTVKDGYVNMDFGAIVDGGSVSGSFMTDLARSEPTIYLKYTASRIQPGPLVDKYLSLTFPGMKATGPLTLIDETYQKLSPAPGELNYEVGDGELIIEGGSVAGRAAPTWMVRVFPGLNLASFDFLYMHSWFKKSEDGRIRHQMIFQGRYYNIYMVGDSVPGGRMQYDVGIDFLADFDSRYWAESGQGRIPLFTKTGRVMPDGTLADEEVVYVPRKFITSLLVENNPLVTAYHAVRKRVRGE